MNKMKKIAFWFVSSKWLWLVAGERYFQCDCLGEASLLDEVGELTVWWGELKRRWNEKKQAVLKQQF